MQGLNTLTGSFNLHKDTPIGLIDKNCIHYCDWIQMHSNSLLFKSKFYTCWLGNLVKYGGALLHSGVGFNPTIERISRMTALLLGKNVDVYSQTTFSYIHPPSNFRYLTEILSDGHAAINHEITFCGHFSFLYLKLKVEAGMSKKKIWHWN